MFALPAIRLALATLIALFVGPLASPASAAVVFNERFDIVEFEFNSCNDESVTLDGFIHFVVKEQPNGSFTLQQNGHGVGVGDQGNEYVWNLQDKLTSNNSEFHTRTRTVLVSKGSAPNEQLTFTFDLPPGTVDVDIECRGLDGRAGGELTGRHEERDDPVWRQGRTRGMPRVRPCWHGPKPLRMSASSAGRSTPGR